MKLSDYVVGFLEEHGVKDVFLLAGGGIMHLLDSLAKNKNINKYYNLHEQASGFAADGYAQCSNKLGVVFATTGPGATNVVTSLASAYIDSTPVLVISGQVKRSDITAVSEVRQTGAQEIGIVPIVESVTKFAITVMNPKDIRSILENAVHLATHGRPGTVWVDIPLDVQAAEIDENNLKGFMPSKATSTHIAKSKMTDFIKMLEQAKRPCILAGTGVVLSGAGELFLEFVNNNKIPVITSRRAKRLFHKGDDRYYYGNAGVVASRYANYILQNSDFLLVLGSGLRYYLTAYNENNFAPKAKKVVVNIHQAEIDKLRMPVAMSFACCVKSFLSVLVSSKIHVERKEWLAYCDSMRERYPAASEVLSHNDGLSDGYMVATCINRLARTDDVFVASPSAFAYTYHIYDLRGTQEYLCPVGLGSMGTALPFAIGACIASGKRRTIVGEGDGSLQHNVQELALLNEYHLPIKLFVDNNNGYRQIYTMQKTHFAGRFAGCTPESGVGLPDLKKLAGAYGIKYYRIDEAGKTEAVVKEVLADDEPTLVEIISSPQVEFIPIIKSRMGKDGKMMSSKLEDLYPFLPEAEQRANMEISRGE